MLPSDIHNKRILLSPLNWGMGHVSRCIPLIDKLLKNDNYLIVAANLEQQQIFKQYFPQLEYIEHSGYPFKFGIRGNFSLDLALQFRSLKKRLKLEKEEVKSFIEKFGFDILISDHRYGFCCDGIFSIFLTHQLNLPVRWFEGWVQKLHERFLANFDEIWVPDSLQSDLSGDLSLSKAGFKVEYIGALSRFSLYKIPEVKKSYSVVIVSGPEVYGKNYLKEQSGISGINASELIFIVPKGLAEIAKKSAHPSVISDDWLACDQLILNSSKVIARSGYSTLMDLFVLKVPFSITPTPFQREQHYLYDLWSRKALVSQGNQDGGEV
jgi:hypothetical protein